MRNLAGALRLFALVGAMVVGFGAFSGAQASQPGISDHQSKASSYLVAEDDQENKQDNSDKEDSNDE